MNTSIATNQPANIIQHCYVIFFIHPKYNQIIFLGHDANIRDICYQNNPLIPGSDDPNKAKRYSSIEEAKKDIYLLRYHHRDFLQIIIGIKKASHIQEIIDNSIPYQNYTLSELTQNIGETCPNNL